MTVSDYLSSVPVTWKEGLQILRHEVLQHLPTGFEECISYGMLGYVVPHTLYPAGYHCNPSLPLPCMGIAARKHTLTFYHMGMYASSELLLWFEEQHLEQTGKKPSMGKSCIRFTKVERIPMRLIGQLVRKLSVEEYIKLYEQVLKKN